MQLIILSENHKLHSVIRLQEEAQKIGISCTHQNPYEGFLPGPKALSAVDSIVLHRCSGYRFDDFDINYSLRLKQAGAKIFNCPKSLMPFRDKELQTTWLQKWEIPHVPSLSFRGRPDRSSLLEHCQKWDIESERFIVKSNRGNGGLGTTLVEGHQSLYSLLETFWAMGDQRFLIQPFLEAKEYRLFFAGGKLLGALLKEKAAGEFRSNFKCQANAINLEEDNIPSSVFDIAKKAYEKSMLHYSGIDILATDQESYILELNTIPGFAQLEEVSGKNIAGELLQSILQTLE